MFDAEFLIFCAGKSSDNRGNISLHGIFDKIYFSNFPGRHTPFIVVAQLRASRPVINKQIHFRLVTELDDKEVASQKIDVPVTVEKDYGFGFEIDFSQFVFPEAGKYSVKLFDDSKLLISRSLQVRSANELVEK